MTEVLIDRSPEMTSQPTNIVSETTQDGITQASVLALASSVVLLPVVAVTEYGLNAYRRRDVLPLISKIRGFVSQEVGYMKSTVSAFHRGKPRLKI